MRRGPVFALSVGLVLAIGAAPALDSAAACWVCAVRDGKPACKKDTIPNFAMESCETRCITLGGRQVCVCRTSGSSCIAPTETLSSTPLSTFPAPSLDGEDDRRRLLLRASPALFRKLPQASAVTHLVLREVRGIHLGLQRGTAAVGPDGALVSFKGWVELDEDGTVFQSYELEGHPELSRIEVALGREVVSILTVHHDGGLEVYDAP